jgi:DNA (cytosine-5)-methyltransferase 1
MSPDRPSPTITTKCYSVSNGRYGHWDERQTRAITPREAAALQTFPADYRFPDRVRTASRMIGNAVPPRLACFFSKFALDQLKTAE